MDLKISDILITSIMFIIMFTIGLALRPKNIQAVLKEKKALAIGLFFQLVFLPLFAFIVLYFSTLSPLLKAGFFIVAISPGGTMSNFISYLLKADLGLSVALTTINTLVILFTVPFLTEFSIHYYLGSNFETSETLWIYLFKTILLLLIPVLLGLFFKYLFPKLSFKIRPPLKLINVLLLFSIYSIKIFGSQASGGSGISFSDIKLILIYALFFHLATISISYFSSLKLGVNKLKSSTIGIEVGLQNTTLALLITSTVLQNNEMSKPAIVFAMFTFFTTLFFAFISIKRAKS